MRESTSRPRISRGAADPVLLKYVPILTSLGIFVALAYQLIQGNAFQAFILGLAAVVLLVAAGGLRLGVAGAAASVPCIIFLVIVFGLPLSVSVDREFFSSAAQAIPAVFIAFAIESGVVRHRTRPEVKAIAVILAVLLSIGEGAALWGVAAVDTPTIGPSGLVVSEPAPNLSWQLTVAVAAIASGFLSIIISMLIRQAPDTVYETGVAAPADAGEPEPESSSPMSRERPDDRSSRVSVRASIGAAIWMFVILRELRARRRHAVVDRE